MEDIPVLEMSSFVYWHLNKETNHSPKVFLLGSYKVPHNIINVILNSTYKTISRVSLRMCSMREASGSSLGDFFMEQTRFNFYPYRWVVLLAFMSIIVVNQLLWITFAPITSAAVEYYSVSELSIGLLSLIFMIVYILVSFPASWVIDTYGVRVGVGIGAALTGIFGLVRGLVASDYKLVLIAQIVIAIGQPFLLNAVTTVAARWFPVEERATATGMGSLAIYLGILLGLALTPYLALRSGIPSLLISYGIVSLVVMLIFFVFIRERPALAA